MVGSSPVQTAATLPSEVSDKDFWSMIVDLSGPGGTYPYENFVSNEAQYQQVRAMKDFVVLAGLSR